MNERYEVVVIGAGMLGASAAYRLACAGRRVVLIEAAEPASGATGNSFSWLNAVSKEPEAYHRLNADGMAEYPGLAEELGVEFGLHGGGSLGWGGTAAEQARIRARVERLEGWGYPAHWISRAEALQLEPALAIGEEVEGVAYHPGDGWVDAPRLVRALVNRALAEGADLRRATPVRSLRRFGERVTAVVTDRDEVAVEQVLVAAGTRTPDLLAPLGFTLPVERVPGLLAVTAPVVARPERVVYAPGVHVRPDPEGGIRIGADDVDALASEETDAEAARGLVGPLLERARAAVPGADGAALTRVHVGIRPVPGDGHTVAGPVPGLSNVWTLVTHSGVTLGPLLGRLIAAEMGGGAMDARLASFRPDRFLADR
jgi:glycine/D-amino acid oxidase-like deaminating enzyme